MWLHLVILRCLCYSQVMSNNNLAVTMGLGLGIGVGLGLIASNYAHFIVITTVKATCWVTI